MTGELLSDESDLDELLETLDEKLNVSTVENTDGEQVERLDLPLNPNQEGFLQLVNITLVKQACRG